MAKKKDQAWVDKKMKKLKEEKREVCKPISSGNYGQDKGKGNKLNNKHIKKLKQEFKAERRAIKHAEKRGWKDEANEIIKEVNKKK